MMDLKHLVISPMMRPMVYFCGFMCREVDDKEFRDHPLNEEYGLCVYVITMLDNLYIILQNDTVDTSKFLIELDKLQSKDMETFSRFNLYDKSVLKAMIFSTSSRKKVQELGIKPDNAVNFLHKVVTASIECERAIS